jgi:signal transduction histidine kinase/CheY-like chemotaxis protein
VGILIVNEGEGLTFLNREFIRCLPTPRIRSEVEQLLGPETGPEEQAAGLAQLLPSLDFIAETSIPITDSSFRMGSGFSFGCGSTSKLGTGTTLKGVLQRQDDKDQEEAVYHMTSDATKRVYEVKTKYLSTNANRGQKIAVIKDQTVYQQLLRQRLLEKGQRMLLASISHEIRNPLHAIEGISTMIFEATNLARPHDLKLLLRCSVQQIDLVLTGACDLMMTDEAGLLIRPQFYRPAEAIEQVVSIVRPTIHAKRLRFCANIDSLVPRLFFSDPKKHQLILYHLLTNAAKYTEKGEIRVDIEYDPISDLLTTAVRDTGPGISEDNIPKLFELYSNAENANEFNPQGMGLGLTLCKRLSKALGGNISLESTVGRGTTVSFTLKQVPHNHERLESEIAVCDSQDNIIQDVPSFEPHPPPTSDSSQAHVPRREGSRRGELQISPEESACENHNEGRSRGSPRPRTALIVDDDATNRLVIKSYLKSLHISVDEADNGLSAVHKVNARIRNTMWPSYKLILMDINMPIMDGTEATSMLMKIFAEHPTARAPVIALTAAHIQSQTHMQDLLAVGFVDICTLVDASLCRAKADIEVHVRRKGATLYRSGTLRSLSL